MTINIVRSIVYVLPVGENSIIIPPLPIDWKVVPSFRRILSLGLI
jgi:hypothetical protein